MCKLTLSIYAVRWIVADDVIVEFCMVSHVPMLSRSDQPTVAIVTSLYCEKLAVDAMIDTKTTYFRCKKGGYILLTLLTT